MQKIKLTNRQRAKITLFKFLASKLSAQNFTAYAILVSTLTMAASVVLPFGTPLTGIRAACIFTIAFGVFIFSNTFAKAKNYF